MKPPSTVIHMMIHLLTLSWVSWLHWDLGVSKASREHQQAETRQFLPKPLSTQSTEHGLDNRHRNIASVCESSALTAEEVRHIVKQELQRELNTKSQGLATQPTVSGDVSGALADDGELQDTEAQMVATATAERILDHALTDRVWTEAHRIELQTILLTISPKKRFDIISKLSEMVNQNQLRMEVPGPIF